MKRFRKVHEKKSVERRKKFAKRTRTFALGEGYNENDIEKATKEMADAGHFDVHSDDK